MADKLFLLWRGSQRVVFNVEDLSVERIATVFKVDADCLYLQDDFSRTARFADGTGSFATTGWHDRTSLEVMGETIDSQPVSDNAGLPPPRALGIDLPHSPGISTNTTNIPFSANLFKNLEGRLPDTCHPLVRGRNVKLTGELLKQVLLIEVDANVQLFPLRTAYLKLKPNDCNIHDIARLAKEHLCMEEELILIDIDGFEITDSPSTRETKFWEKNAVKIYVCRAVEYEKVKQKQSSLLDKCGKRKRSHESVESLRTLRKNVSNSVILEKLNGIEEQLQKNTKLNKLEALLRNTFKCCICLNVMSACGVDYASCCDRLVACTPCADRWYEDNSTCPHCKNEDGQSYRKRPRGFESLLEILH